MFRNGLVGGVLATVATGALVLPLAAPAGAVEVDLEAGMHATAAFPNARGHAEYESDSHGREFDISVAGIKALAGKQVTVRVHGDFVGRMTVRADGRAHLDKHSGVPKVSKGDAVRVRTGSGTLVTYGTFHVDQND